MRSVTAPLLAAWRSPWTVAVLALLLAADAIAMGLVARHQTAVGSTVRRVVWRDNAPFRNEHVVSLFLIRQDAAGYVVIGEQDSAGELAVASQKTPDRVVSVSYWAGRWWTGWWSPRWSRTLSRVEVFTLSTGAEPLAEADRSAARAAVAGWLETHGRPEAARTVRAGDVNTTAILWWGWVNDALVLILAASLAATLVRLPLTLRLRTVRGALSRGVCPRCRYNLAGLEGDIRRCPECGRAWDMTRLRAAGTTSAPG